MKKKSGKKKNANKKVIKHLKGDIRTFKEEAAQDRALIKDLKKPRKKAHRESAAHERAEKPSHERSEKRSKKKNKIEKVMREYKEGKLHSGSKKGPEVTKRKQALAIALSEAKRAAKSHKKKK